MNVKRYGVGVDGIDPNGNLVKYEDYAALEQKLAESQREFRAADATIENLQMQVEKLAAENAGLKEACGGDGSYRDCPACAHSEYIEAPDTTETDAFLAEVRASAVEEFVRMADYSESVADGEVIVTSNSVFSAGHAYADQIRKGVQS